MNDNLNNQKLYDKDYDLSNTDKILLEVKSINEKLDKIINYFINENKESNT